MTITENDALFEDFARELAVRFTAAIAGTLAKSDLVDFDLDKIEKPQIDLLFNLCFNGIVQFEEQSGFFSGNDKYTPRPVFELKDGTSSIGLMIGKASVHGFTNDDDLEEGIARARGG